MSAPRRLRILHTEASLGWGGQEIRILTEAAGMIARGHDVSLVCPNDARIFQGAKDYGVPVHALPIGRKNVRGVAALRRHLRNAKFDVINTHSSTDSWLAALACKTLRDAPPIVRTRHISAAVPNNISTQWLYRRATSKIVTTGESLRQQLIRDNGIDPENVVSIPTGIDTKRFTPGDRHAARSRVGLPESVLIVGIVATLRSWKGHRYLIDAFAQLERKDVMLVIVGGGPQQEALRTQVAALSLQDRVQMAGNQSDVIPWLQSFDVFVLPSYANEGVPQAILQAMACGLPIVTTRAGAIPEVVTEGETALIVPTQDTHALTDALSHLLGNSALRVAFGAKAREVAADRFGIAHMLEKMESLFLQTARNG